MQKESHFIPTEGKQFILNDNGYCYVDSDSLLGVVYTEEDLKEFNKLWKERINKNETHRTR